MNAQKIDLYQPMINSRVGPPPIALRVGVTPSPMMTEGGPISSPLKIEMYVLLSALPVELQERVRTAVQVLVAGR